MFRLHVFSGQVHQDTSSARTSAAMEAARAAALSFKALANEETLLALEDAVKAAEPDGLAVVFTTLVEMRPSEFMCKGLDVLFTRIDSLPHKVVEDDFNQVYALIQLPLISASITRFVRSSPSLPSQKVSDIYSLFTDNANMIVADNVLKIYAQFGRKAHGNEFKRIVHHLKKTEDSEARLCGINIMWRATNYTGVSDVNFAVASLVDLLKLPDADKYSDQLLALFCNHNAVCCMDTPQIKFLSDKFIKYNSRAEFVAAGSRAAGSLQAMNMLETLLGTEPGVRLAIDSGVMCKLAANMSNRSIFAQCKKADLIEGLGMAAVEINELKKKLEVLENERTRATKIMDKLNQDDEFALVYDSTHIPMSAKLLAACSDFFKARFVHDETNTFQLDKRVPLSSYELLFGTLPLCSADWGLVDFDILKGICVACEQMYFSEDDSIALALRIAAAQVIKLVDSDNCLQTIVYFKDLTTNYNIKCIVEHASKVALKSVTFDDPNWTVFEDKFPTQAMQLLKRKREDN